MPPADKFINPRLSIATLDTYVHRSRLAAALRCAAPAFSGVLLDVGCGHMPYREMILGFGGVERYVGLDLAQNPHYCNAPDLLWDGLEIPLPEDSVNCVIALEVLEHCPDPDSVLREIKRVLVPGGMFFFTVPFLWPLHNVPADQYRYTPFALQRSLTGAGFVDVHVHALGGWDASLAQMIGLYVRRRTMPSCLRAILSIFVWPLVALLALRDRTVEERTVFAESSMVSGLWGGAGKHCSDIRKGGD